MTIKNNDSIPYADMGTNTGWTCDRDPLTVEINPAGFFNYGSFFRNSITGKLFLQISQPDFTDNGDGTYTTSGLEWQEVLLGQVL